MEGSTERDSGVLGGLFQQIISDLKNGTPLWEDLIYKATKLQVCLRATIQAIAAYLDAFQKIADAATNTRGATKEIGTALTRICLRHRAVEAKMKTFTSAIMDCLVAPLQEKLEDWKKSVMNLDKEHAKDHKRARAELKKRSTDTLRLQKKVRKGGKTDDLHRAMKDVSEKKVILEEAEKKAVRAALIEERSRYCLFVTFLKPVVDEEVAMLSELSHLQEVMDQLEKHSMDPYSLPAASEQVISDLKGSDTTWTFQSPPSSSPSSLGSRKSSMCSINSLNSSSSGSSKSHHSPNHLYWNRSISQLSTVNHRSSQDSGFNSQDALCIRNSTASYFQQQVSDMMEENIGSSAESAGTLAMPTATWPNLQDTLQFEKAATAIMNDRPHTISAAYERGHQRPALSVYTFQTPENSHSQPCSPSTTISVSDTTPVVSPQAIYASTNMESQLIYTRPPIPERGSSLDRPSVPVKPFVSAVRSCHSNSDIYFRNMERTMQPTYVNTNELANMAANKGHTYECMVPVPPPMINDLAAIDNHNNEKNECVEKESSNSESSLESSSGYGSQSGISVTTATPPDHDTTQCAEEVYSGIRNITINHNPNAYLIENPYHNPECIRQRTSYSSNSSGYCTIKSGTLSRRGSVQTQKPPPPVRRTSSILNCVRQVTSLTSQDSINSNSLENLPPPPAFLLESTSTPVAATTTITIGQNVNIGFGNIYSGSVGSDLDNLNTKACLRRNAANFIAAEIEKRNSLNSIEQIKICSTQKTASASAEPLRKSSFTCIYPPAQNTIITDEEKIEKKIEIEKSGGISVAETVRTLTEMNHQPASPVLVRRTHSNRSISADRRQETGLIAALSARITPNLSPRHSRKHQDSKQIIPTANRVRQWIALRSVSDPATCHDSLMDQIKRGTRLRPTRMIDDRSFPTTD